MLTVALDTNVLAYAEQTNGPIMQRRALAVVEKLLPEGTVVPAQTLGELFNVLVKKARWPTARASAAVTAWGDTYPIVDTSSDIMLAAIELTRQHQLGIWDAVVLASAADARARLLLSEDLQDGFTWRGVTVVNPFGGARHPLLNAILKG
ncbi:MAG TPA: PIN domain-containing protein [Vicinamibacterales bacterium]|nr:PIN domain-containing protein [Vicinamibacterales bacterium]